MKKTLILTAVLLTFSTFLFGCGDSNSNKDNNNNTVKAEANNSEIGNPTKNTQEFEEKTNANNDKKSIVETKLIRIYFYDGVNDVIYYKDESVEVTDGALVTAIINSLKVNRGDNYCTLDSNIAVKSAKLDKEKDTLTVNFGEKFVNNMNLGSGAESSVLTSVVNSLGYNFGVSKVYITVNGKEYSSGHIKLEEGEPFTVNYKGVTEFKN
ncbi:MAG: GerMN domain-containing protein [Clostridiales bacterium]|nr:GerMN domain-containing protein [Clostridiales bacterium]